MSTLSRAPSEHAFRAIFDVSLDALVLMDARGIVLDLNAAASTLFGRDRASVIGTSAERFAPPATDFARALRELEESGEARGQMPLVTADGTTRVVQFVSMANVVPGAHLTILRDVTAARAAEHHLRQSEFFLSEAQAVAHIGSWVSGLGMGDRLIWSKECYRIFGIDEGTPVTVGTFFERVYSGDRDAVAAATKDAIERGMPYEIEHRVVRPDGEVRWVFQRAIIERAPDGSPLRMIGVVQDITERRHVMEAQRRLAAIVESSEDAIVGASADGAITSWNRAAENLFGFAERTMIGVPIAELAPPERATETIVLARRVAAGESVESFETKRVRKDGSEIDVSLTLSPIHGPAGEVVGISMIARDLTERRRAEAALRRSEEHLRQAQKLEAIGSLAGGVAHDFNNLLSVILSYTSLMLSHMSAQDPLRGDLEEIRRAGERAAALTRQLLAFSRKQVLQPKVVDLGRVVAGMEKMLRRLVGEDIELTLVLPANVCGAFVDPTQAEQVVMNLVANARDAMPRGGKLVIEVARAELDARCTTECPGVSPGPYVELSVTDTGAGIDQATRARIFDPFFTTKEKGKGTGLGLSTVQGIVHQSGGAVRVDSTPGVGTTLRVYFPCADREVAEVIMQPAAPNLGGSETILLVEDEEQVRIVVRTILRRSGYEVLEAQNAGEALLICEQFGAPIELLLTDVVMPRMGGRELAERLRPIRPDMRIIFMSGHTEDAVLHHGVSEEAMAFLQKPVTPDSLLRKVREVLDESSLAVH